MNFDQTFEKFASIAVDEGMVTDAQRKLEALIAARAAGSRRVTRMRGWLAAAATAAVVTVAVLLLPLAPTPALAFSVVQQQLRDFDTLSFVIDQRVGGQNMMQTRVQMTREGNVRTEIGKDITVIVNSSERRVLMLMNTPRIARLLPLAERVEKSEQLAWLDQVREFQGVATPLQQMRVIDGRKAHGWEFAVAGMQIVMWATDEGMPLEMNIGQGTSTELLFHFNMNRPLAAGLFSTRVPDGYALATADD